MRLFSCISLVTLLLLACGSSSSSSTPSCAHGQACVQSSKGLACMTICDPDAGSVCPTGQVCTRADGCCTGTECSTTIGTVCCPSTGC